MVEVMGKLRLRNNELNGKLLTQFAPRHQERSPLDVGKQSFLVILEPAERETTQPDGTKRKLYDYLAVTEEGFYFLQVDGDAKFAKGSGYDDRDVKGLLDNHLRLRDSSKPVQEGYCLPGPGARFIIGRSNKFGQASNQSFAFGHSEGKAYGGRELSMISREASDPEVTAGFIQERIARIKGKDQAFVGQHEDRHRVQFETAKAVTEILG